MTGTITLTHHQTKPEYQWEIVLPEGPTIMLREEHLADALRLLGVSTANDLHQQLESLPNGESRSVEADLDAAAREQLMKLSVKTI